MRSFAGVTSGTDGRSYTVGGGYCSNACAPPLASFEAYDPGTDTWERLPPMPTARLYPQAVTGRDGRIYVIDGDVRDTQPTPVVEAYSPDTATWASLAPLPAEGFADAVAGTDDRIYATMTRVGADDEQPDSMYEYDAADDPWLPVAPRPADFNAQLLAGPDGRYSPGQTAAPMR